MGPKSPSKYVCGELGMPIVGGRRVLTITKASECPAMCPADVQPCANGLSLSRDPENGCKFPKCPVKDKTDETKPTGRFNLKNLGKTRPDTTNLVSKVEGKQGVEKGNVVVKLVKTVRSKITSNLDKAGLKSNLQAAFPKSTVTVAESAKRRRLANEYDVTIATDVTNKADEPEITTAVLTSLDGVDAASEPEVQYKAEVEAGLQEGTSKDDLQSIADDAARDLGATAGEVNVTEPTDDGSEDDDGKTSASALAALMVGVLGVLML
jgi:pyruvoyl-dependent arginine decarboxylase (PvlArgDC)